MDLKGPNKKTHIKREREHFIMKGKLLFPGIQATPHTNRRVTMGGEEQGQGEREQLDGQVDGERAQTNEEGIS